jgi:hypothetical protein
MSLFYVFLFCNHDDDEDVNPCCSWSDFLAFWLKSGQRVQVKFQRYGRPGSVILTQVVSFQLVLQEHASGVQLQLPKPSDIQMTEKSECISP